ncbi:hypothetical protein CDAR_504331 [Caerostris darwini]|uniref:Uncharacterized protein n=1 Tax=Caerostris darwini TaxID=1538125 RepID=A0AAV4S1Y2_9ARAC|nr:hypothetical protein CDAR_504331 [Caerostris darwini]
MEDLLSSIKSCLETHISPITEEPETSDTEQVRQNYFQNGQTGHMAPKILGGLIFTHSLFDFASTDPNEI